jgi:hypothetical protein
MYGFIQNFLVSQAMLALYYNYQNKIGLHMNHIEGSNNVITMKLILIYGSCSLATTRFAIAVPLFQ